MQQLQGTTYSQFTNFTSPMISPGTMFLVVLMFNPLKHGKPHMEHSPVAFLWAFQGGNPGNLFFMKHHETLKLLMAPRFLMPAQNPEIWGDNPQITHWLIIILHSKIDQNNPSFGGQRTYIPPGFR